MERRTGRSKRKTINNKYTIMKTDKIKKVLTILIKALKWLYTLLSKK